MNIEMSMRKIDINQVKASDLVRISLCFVDGHDKAEPYGELKSLKRQI